MLAKPHRLLAGKQSASVVHVIQHVLPEAGQHAVKNLRSPLA
jgi:hypothetical protein